MKTKTEISYKNVFDNFKLILLDYNIKVDFSKIYIFTNFEKSLRNAIVFSFPNSNLIGCYFHYIKSLVKKMKELGMLKKI